MATYVLSTLGYRLVAIDSWLQTLRLTFSLECMYDFLPRKASLGVQLFKKEFAENVLVKRCFQHS